MRKILLCFAVFAMAISTSMSQIKVGAFIGVKGPLIGASDPSFQNISSDGTVESLIGGPGGGLEFNGLFEFGVNDVIAFGIDVTYLNGFTLKLEKIGDPAFEPPNGPGGINTDTEITSKRFSVTPHIVFYAGPKFYSKLGLVIGLSQEVSILVKPRNFPQPGNLGLLYEGGTDLGATAAFGMRFPFSDAIEGFAEIGVLSLIYKPDQLTTTEAFGGPVSDPIKFKQEATAAELSSGVAPSHSITFSNVGLNFGVKYNF